MSKSNLTVILNGEQVFCDELIRESARLAIQHEADKLTIEALRQQVQDLERYAKEAEEAGAMCNAVQKEAAMMKAELDAERMTLKELSQLYYLNREIEMDKRRLQELEVKALPGAQVITGMPHAPGVTDKVGEYAAEIADLRGIIEAKHQQCLYERSRLERYISSIDDSLLRQIFTYRFVNGLPWRQVAACIGGGNTEDGCRKAVKRYLERN